MVPRLVSFYLVPTAFASGGYNGVYDWNSFAHFFQKILTFEMF